MFHVNIAEGPMVKGIIWGKVSEQINNKHGLFFSGKILKLS